MNKTLLYFSFCFSALVPLNAYTQTWVTVGPSGYTGDAGYTSIAIDSNGTPYVAYEDNNISYGPASVMKFNGSSWVYVGNRGFSGEWAEYTSIAIDEIGTPYVVYSDGSDTGKATVMKYDSSTWVNVGNPGFSGGEVEYTSIAIDGSGIPYVVYKDYDHGGAATVMKYNGRGWIDVGNPGFSAQAVEYTSIAIDRSGTPYVVYEDRPFDSTWGPATVMKFNGSDWVNVGTPGFSTGGAQYTTIAINKNGTPYVVYCDGGDTEKATVMKYNGSSWVNVGSPGFSAYAAYYTSIAIDPSGTPYVTYVDEGNGGVATAMKFNGSQWETVGREGFSVEEVWNTSIAIDRYGTPYVDYNGFTWSSEAMVMKLDTALGPITGAFMLCIGDTTTLSDRTSGGVWSSSNVTIGTIGTSTGIVTSVATGWTTISYTASGYSAIFTLAVDSIPVPGTLSAFFDSVCVGDSIELYNSVEWGTWSSINTSIATITSGGLLTGITSGAANLVYIITNACGSDTANYSFPVGNSCPDTSNQGTTVNNNTIASLTIFPNPNYGSFTLYAYSPKNENATITITNILGEKVEEFTIVTNTYAIIPITLCARGMYFISAVTTQGKQIRKVVVL